MSSSCSALGHNRGAAQPSVAVAPRRGQLGDQREAGRGGELAGLLRRLGHGGLRAGYAELAAQLVEGVLARDPAREIPRRVGEQEPLPQPVALLGEEDRARVVGRYQHGRPADPLGQPQQAGADPLRLVRVRLPEKAAPQVTGAGRGRPRPFVHPVHGHAHATQAPDHAKTAVMHDVRIELQHHRRRGFKHFWIPLELLRAMPARRVRKKQCQMRSPSTSVIRVRKPTHSG